MSKNFVQDIVQKRSLKEILPTKTRMTTSISKTEEKDFEANDLPLAGIKRSRTPKSLLWLIGGVLIVFILIIISSAFSQVTIDIMPRRAKIVLTDKEFNAKLQASSGELEFGRVTEEITEEATVKATSVRKVERKASGKITIFNNFDEKVQELVINTRFETADGKIYRIDKAVNVPGKTMVDGKEVPGEVLATVYADKAGEAYNIETATFTIPGFKGTPRYEKFSATSQTAMTGGFVGEIKAVSEAEEKKIRDGLRAELDKKTITQLKAPLGFIVFSDQLAKTHESVPTINNGDEIKIIEKMPVTALMINEKKLAQFLAEKFIPDYQGEGVEITNLKELKLMLLDKANLNLNTATEIKFNISGANEANLIWIIEPELLKDKIRGLNKEQFKQEITKFKAIESVIPKFRPPWLKTIPDNPDKIKIKLSVN